MFPNWIKHKLMSFKYRRKNPTLRMFRGTLAYDCTFGEHNIIYDDAVLVSVEMGSYSYVGGRCRLQNCKIGKFCSIGAEVLIGLGVHPLHYKSTHPGFYAKDSSYYGFEPEYKNEFPEYKPVTIGNDVWIGTRAIILDGVHIGDGAVVGAGAVVTKDVPPYAVVGGVPAKVIKYRFNPETISQLLQEKWWDKK